MKKYITVMFLVFAFVISIMNIACGGSAFRTLPPTDQTAYRNCYPTMASIHAPGNNTIYTNTVMNQILNEFVASNNRTMFLMAKGCPESVVNASYHGY